MPLSLKLIAMTVLPAFTLAALPAQAGEITVTIIGTEDRPSEIGCSLYAGEEGFPMDPSKATSLWQPLGDGRLSCRFSNLSPGAYAVAVSQDFNGNRETDTNFLGIPREPWGVTNNVRPGLRAPRFEEAQIILDEGQTLAIEVELDR